MFITFFIYYIVIFFFFYFVGQTTFERIAACRAFRTQMDALLNTLSPDDEYSVIPPDRY
jgi:hypothetical protein